MAAKEKQKNRQSIIAAIDLFKEFSSNVGSYRRMTVVNRPDNDLYSLGASLHILFKKKTGSSAKEKDTNNGKNINLFIYKIFYVRFTAII